MPPTGKYYTLALIMFGVCGICYPCFVFTVLVKDISSRWYTEEGLNPEYVYLLSLYSVFLSF